MDTETNIYDYILAEERFYQTMPVPIVDGYEWNMYRHIMLSTLYKNSQYETGNKDDKPFRNIIRPIVNVAYRSEGFDVKDIQPFADDEKNYYKTFLVRKFHPRWARKNHINQLIEDIVESYVDYGGALIKNINGVCPEVVALQDIAFCDQTDILSSVIAFKHQFTPDQLIAMKKWDKEMIDLTIDQARQEKPAAQSINGVQKAKTPGKYIEVYELHGYMPTNWLIDKYFDDEDLTSELAQHDYTKQAQYVTFYKDALGNKKGITLFKVREEKEVFKFISRDKIYGRALGFGGIEELFEPQVWTNYSIIQMKEMLDTAALMILQSASSDIGTKNKITDMEKGEIIDNGGDPITQVQITPINYELFNKSIQDWENNARITGSASDPQLGVNPTDGTPFKLQDLVTQTGQDLHEFRQGKISDFMADTYRDWIMPFLVKDMNAGNKWIDELSADEMHEVADTIAENEKDKWVRDSVINKNKMVAQDIADQYKQAVLQSFMSGGRKKFLEIVKGELTKIPMDVEMNIAGKQRDLSRMTDKLVNVFREVIGNPQVLQDPAAAKIFNQILEASGLDPLDFIGFERAAAPAQMQGKNGGGQGMDMTGDGKQVTPNAPAKTAIPFNSKTPALTR